MSMPLKKRYRILRLGVMALTVLAFVGLMLQMMWIIWVVVALLAGWVALPRVRRLPGPGGADEPLSQLRGGVGSAVRRRDR